jgi:hypothetical protein
MDAASLGFIDHVYYPEGVSATVLSTRRTLCTYITLHARESRPGMTACVARDPSQRAPECILVPSLRIVIVPQR